ncbi:Alpha/beta-Hydrolases superfamily protein, putative isoform 2 [Hibiscus syriacus]|uniref:Alpha/beta-Hydrolases superfamily protein, putative isoform 2 n=1 Tax=Hibiscus syriacus TaxID=106335 RepID=A0A6A2WUT7_HIBSY|nr:2-hydroxy-6-oxononadienedioate/2-hydroxy-6-oxononatrienedioate hydrolase 1 [Hibiscus syriacus]KAE8665293.1 Alpha/beta-Hydrolases superfamily protein, putative isoform 2 [Hibiscus syriacus]
MAPAFLSIVSLYGIYLRRCLTASGLTSKSIDIDDDTTIHLWSPKPDQQQQKPALLLLHGFGPSAIWQWRRQVQFCASYFDVYVPDLVFFGGSTTKSNERSEVFQAVSMAKLMEKLRVKKYHVMGTSYGGFVAYHMAKLWPDTVEKVVIASSGVNMRKADNTALLERANVENIEEIMLPETATQIRTLSRLAVSWRFNMVPDFFWNDIVNQLYSDNRQEKLELLKGVTLAAADESFKLTPLQQNVLIVWGDKDQIFPLKLAHELKELLGKKTRLEIIENTAHVPQIEDSSQFNKIIKNFLCG